MIQFTVTPEFLDSVDIDINSYGPAYDGTSVGLDLYSVSDILVPCLSNFGPKKFDTLIPTGIKLKLLQHTQGLILERGSITKTPLKVRAGVIDPGYTGEIFVNCINLASSDYYIAKGSKLPFQLVCTTALPFRLIDEKTYQVETKDSIRKEACIGSSDKN